MSKKKSMSKREKKRILLSACGAFAVILAVLAYFRYLTVPDAPAASDAFLYADSSLCCAYLGEGYSVAILSPCGDGATDAASFLGRQSARYDCAVLLDCSDEGVELARYFAANSHVRTILVPRATKKEQMNAIAKAGGDGCAVKRLPWRKGMIVGDLLLYDVGKSGGMALSVTHGSEKVLHAAAPCGGQFDLAFCAGDSVLSSSFVSSDGCFVVDGGADWSASKVQTTSIASISGVLERFLAGAEGDDAPQ